MLSEPLTKMLILQDREMKLQQVESQLLSLPAERAACQAKIAELKARVEASKHRLKELEARAKGLEVEMKSVEQQVIKYKNQQLMVKKNDEYQALIHEIDTAQGRISALESDELELLYALDEARSEQKQEELQIAELLRFIRHRRITGTVFSGAYLALRRRGGEPHGSGIGIPGGQLESGGQPNPSEVCGFGAAGLARLPGGTPMEGRWQRGGVRKQSDRMGPQRGFHNHRERKSTRSRCCPSLGLRNQRRRISSRYSPVSPGAKEVTTTSHRPGSPGSSTRDPRSVPSSSCTHVPEGGRTARKVSNSADVTSNSTIDPSVTSMK